MDTVMHPSRLILCLYAAWLVIAPSPSFAADLNLEHLDPLVGDWRGVGNGKWGTSAVDRSFARILDGAFVRSEGHSAYPRQERNPNGEIHRFIDFFSFDTSTKTLVLREFDNESFVATYALSIEESTEQRLVFDSTDLENIPAGWRARIVYQLNGPDSFQQLFYLDTNKGAFELYLTNDFIRTGD